MRPLPWLVTLWVSVGCAGDPEQPNLLWIVSDTLRADVLGCYGGAAKTPHLCALAERGVLFENAYSNAAWTLPAAVTMFTGGYSSVYERPSDPEDSGDHFYYVPEGEELLAEQLRARGYDVVAFVENAIAGQANALQGFERVDFDRIDALRDIGSIEARTGLDTRDVRYRKLIPALRFLLEPRPRPFAALVWIYDPHASYTPPIWKQHELSSQAGRVPRPLEFYMGLGHQDQPERGLRKLKFEVRRMVETEIELLRELYREEVESMDERVGNVLAALEAAGRTESTLVLFTSDHGEAFGEHRRRFLHGNSYYDELVRVPLIVAGPGVSRGRRERQVVSHVDLVPTLGEMLGIERPDGPGRSFAPLLRGDGAAGGVPRGEAYIVGIQSRRFVDALVQGPLKLIAKKSGEQMLFDRRSDPGEQEAVSKERSSDAFDAMAGRLRAIRERSEARRLEQQRAFAEEASIRRVEDETASALRELGYIE